MNLPNEAGSSEQTTFFLHDNPSFTVPLKLGCDHRRRSPIHYSRSAHLTTEVSCHRAHLYLQCARGRSVPLSESARPTARTLLMRWLINTESSTSGGTREPQGCSQAPLLLPPAGSFASRFHSQSRVALGSTARRVASKILLRLSRLGHRRSARASQRTL